MSTNFDTDSGVQNIGALVGRILMSAILYGPVTGN